MNLENDIAPQHADEAAASILTDLKGGGAQEQAFVPPKKSATRMLIVVGVAAIGGASLWAMRTYATRIGVALNTPLIEVDTTTTQKLTPNQERIIAVLSDDGPPPQVPAQEITKNPFELGLDRPQAIAGNRFDGSAQNDAARLAREREQAIQRELAGFRLSSIIGGARPLAMISGGTYMAGSSLGQYFKVVSIEGRVVVLEADSKRYELRLRD